MTPHRKSGSVLATGNRETLLAPVRSASEALGQLLLELQRSDRLDDATRARVTSLRDALAQSIESLNEASLRKPFLHLDTVLRYGLQSGALGPAVRAFLELESALSSLAVDGRRAAPLLPIAAASASAPPRTTAATPPPLPERPASLGAAGAARALAGLRPAQSPPRPPPEPPPETAPLRARSGKFRRPDAGIAPPPPPAPVPPAPAPAPPPGPPTAPAPIAAALNRLSFQDLGGGDRPTHALDALTSSGERRRLAQSARPAPFAGIDTSAIDLAWLGNDELDALDEELARATEPSGLLDLDRSAHATAPTDEDDLEVDVDLDEEPPLTPADPTSPALKLLPEPPAGGFEDSGLFLIFVDESELQQGASSSNNNEPLFEDELSLEIEIAPPTALSAAEQAYRGFVEHVDSILLRLVDSLELALLGNQATELLDVHRQLNRLARVLDFVELDRQLSLIVYLQELLPVDFAPRDEPFLLGRPRLEIVRDALHTFQGHIGELLNGLVYLLGYLIHEVPGLRRERYQRPLVEIYGQLGILPAEPSAAAPTGPYGHADGLKLTSRTRALIARALELRLSETLEGIEGALLHGHPQGFVEAAHVMYATAQALADQGIPDVPQQTEAIALYLDALEPGERPDHELVSLLRDLVDRLSPILPLFQGEPLVERLQALLERATFSERHSTGRHRGLVLPDEAAATDTEADFAHHWPRFRQAAAPLLDTLLGLTDEIDSLPLVDTVHALRGLAAQHRISLLERLLGTLLQHWERAPHTCGHVLGDLAASVRALPSEGARFEQLEALARSVVDDLVRRRSWPSTPQSGSGTGSTHQRVTDELGTAALRLLTQVEAFARLLQRVIERREPSHLEALRADARELADAARDREAAALALSLDVIADLASSGERALDDSGDDSTPSLFEALGHAQHSLSEALDDLVERLDDGGDPQQATGCAGTGSWFSWWLRHADVLLSSDSPSEADATLPLVLRRTLHETGSGAIERIETLWQSLGSSAQFNAAQLAEYQQALEILRQLTGYWHRPELERGIAEHHVELVSLGGRDDLDRFGERWSALRAALRAELPAAPVVRLDASGQRFATTMLGWASGLQARLDGGEARALHHWPSEARALLEQAAPLARASRCVPWIGLACELRNVLVTTAELRSHEASLPVLEQLLFWVQRLVLGLVPALAAGASGGEAGVEAGASASRPLVVPTSIRVPLAPTLELARQARGLSEQIATMQALIAAGPLTFAGQAGRQALETLRGALKDLDEVVVELAPGGLRARLEQLAARCEHRGRLLARAVRVETWLNEVPAPRGKSLDDSSRARLRRQELLVTILAGLETLAEGVIDLGFESGLEQPGGGASGASLRVELEAGTEQVRAVLDHNAAGLDLKRALTALESTGMSPPPPSGVIGALGSTPQALRRLRGGSVLVLVDAMLTRVGASLLLEEVGGWHRFAIEWRDVGSG